MLEIPYILALLLLLEIHNLITIEQRRVETVIINNELVIFIVFRGST
jgi:hypothetical protein